MRKRKPSCKNQDSGVSRNWKTIRFTMARNVVVQKKFFETTVSAIINTDNKRIVPSYLPGDYRLPIILFLFDCCHTHILDNAGKREKEQEPPIKILILRIFRQKLYLL